MDDKKSRNKASFLSEVQRQAINIYTDGSLMKKEGEEWIPGIGIYCSDPALKINTTLSLLLAPPTNAHAELAAVASALEIALERNI